MGGLGSWIERHASVAPDRPAVVEGELTRTYCEMAGRVRRLANGLRGLGVCEGDRIGWIGPNRAAFLELLFATAKIGAVLEPVNHRLAETEIARLVAIGSPRIVAVERSLSRTPMPACVDTLLIVGADDSESLAPGSLAYEPLISGSPDTSFELPWRLDRLCMLPHTSGTTGSPKGIMLTEGNLTWNVLNMLTGADIRPGDATIAIAPFFRTGGIGVNVLPVLFRGGTVVIPQQIEADEILRLSEAHRVTVGFGNPDLLEAIAGSPLWPSADLSSLRFIVTGGAPVPERLIRRYLEKGIVLLQGYGLSEASPAVLLLPPEKALTKVGSAGQPLRFLDIRIVRKDGSGCGIGETGELLVRGPNVMAGYWEHPAETNKALEPSGWLHTGDASRLDSDGDVWIVDRLADGYWSGGRMVFPADVERALLQHPGVEDAGAVGMAGLTEEENWGAAFVVLRGGASAGEDELLAWCRDHLPGPAEPRWVRIVEQVPRTSVGKLLRAELKRRAS